MLVRPRGDAGGEFVRVEMLGLLLLLLPWGDVSPPPAKDPPEKDSRELPMMGVCAVRNEIKALCASSGVSCVEELPNEVERDRGRR